MKEYLILNRRTRAVEVILNRKRAIKRFHELIDKGYSVTLFVQAYI